MLSCEVKIKDESFISLEVNKTSLKLIQDGKPLCESKIDLNWMDIEKLGNAKLNVGIGSYGRFEGELIQEIWRKY